MAKSIIRETSSDEALAGVTPDQEEAIRAKVLAELRLKEQKAAKAAGIDHLTLPPEGKVVEAGLIEEARKQINLPQDSAKPPAEETLRMREVLGLQADMNPKEMLATILDIHKKGKIASSAFEANEVALDVFDSDDDKAPLIG